MARKGNWGWLGVAFGLAGALALFAIQQALPLLPRMPHMQHFAFAVDILIAVGIILGGVRMAFFGVHVTLHPPPDEPSKNRNKREFIVWGLLSGLVRKGPFFLGFPPCD